MNNRITRRAALARIGLAPGIALSLLYGSAEQSRGEKSLDHTRGADSPKAVFNSNGRQIAIGGPGIVKVEAAFTARITRGGNSIWINSLDPNLLASQSTGKGISSATIVDRPNGVRMTVTVRHSMDNGFSLQGEVENLGSEPLALYEINILDTTDAASVMLLDGSHSRWNGVGFTTYAPPVPLDTRLSQQVQIGSGVGIYRDDGTGFLIGSAGTGNAACPVFVRPQSNNSVRMFVQSWMCGIDLDKGEVRSGEETIFLFAPPAIAVEKWACLTAKALNARTSRGAISGWCSWYDRDIRITEDHVVAQCKTIKANRKSLPLEVIQIDDGYQKMDGDWDANERFPNGMAYSARMIANAGLIPGLWISPLKVNPGLPWAVAHPECLQLDTATGKPRFEQPNMYHPDGKLTVDPTHPASQEFIRSIIQKAVQNGYKYLKLDFNDIQQVGLYDKRKTQLQAMRDLYKLYREAAGSEVYINSCMATPELAIVGYADACRVGPDSYAGGGLQHAVDPVMHAQPFNGIWFANDPDVTYLSDKLQSTVQVAGGSEMLRTWHSIVGFTGGLAMTSDPLDAPDCREHWPFFEMLLPPSRRNSRLIGLGQNDKRNCFGFNGGHGTSAYGVYLAMNRAMFDRDSVRLNFSDLGLSPHATYLVWSFWDDACLGLAHGAWETPAMDPLSSQLIRFTNITGREDDIVLAGSTLHITCGAAEVRTLHPEPHGMTICLTNAGARAGTLTLFSRSAIRIDARTGCEAKLVEIGNGMWKIFVSNRDPEISQKIGLMRTT